MTESHPTTAPRSRGLQALGVAIVLAGMGTIFAGEFELLRSAPTAGIGGGLIGLGMWLYLRGRLPKT